MAASDIARAWWPKEEEISPLDALREIVAALEEGRIPEDRSARHFAAALRAYLAGQLDITRNLGLRPRRGGRHESPAARERTGARNAIIRRVFDAQSGTKTGKAKMVAALLRADAPAGEVTEGQLRADLNQLRQEFGADLPGSWRQVVRLVDDV